MHVAVCRSHNYQHELHISRGERVRNVNNKKLIIFKGFCHLQKDFGPAHLKSHNNGQEKNCMFHIKIYVYKYQKASKKFVK